MPESRVRACNECRQQKLRCDVIRDPTRPCSRCQRLKLGCVISDSFQRSKSQSKADLLNEVNRLKAKLMRDRISSDPMSPIRSTDSQGIIPQTDRSIPGSSTSGATGDSLTAPSIVAPTPKIDRASASVISPPCGPATLFPAGSNIQMLDDCPVENSKIVDCFALFYQHYAPWLPGIFDPSISPNRHFQNSKLLFWTIVCTGARRYKKDPTIFDRVSKRIAEETLAVVCLIDNPIAAVQALLLLCTWPLPTTTLFKDHSPSCAGLAMSLAMQNGLHTFCKGEEFASRPNRRQPLVGMPAARLLRMRGNLSNDSARIEINFRSRLWIHCLVVCQSTNICHGLPFLTAPENEGMERRQAIDEMLDARLKARYKLHLVQTEAVATIRRSVDLESTSCGPELISLINIFERQVALITIEKGDAVGILDRDCARLVILSFHFFVRAEDLDQQGFLQLFSVAQAIIMMACELDSASCFAHYMPVYYVRMISVAAYCILRISKSELKQQAKLGDASSVFFQAIELTRQSSIQHGDLDAVNSIMLTKLWSSNQVFVRPDGTRNSLQLDLRGRLSMSVVYDCFWWWRNEFGHLFNNAIQPQEDDPWPGCESTSIGDNTGPPPVNSMGEFPMHQVVDFSECPDWDWSANLGAFEEIFYSNYPMDFGAGA